MEDMELQKNIQSLYGIIRKSQQYTNDRVSLIESSVDITDAPAGVINPVLWKLSKWVEILSKSDMVCFMNGWNSSTLCFTLCQIAETYGLTVFFEEDICKPNKKEE